MKAPDISGTIRRRLLVNWRMDPERMQALLPEPFRPHLSNGWGVAGICFVGLQQHRPSGLPAFAGVASEGAAHRFAVEWDDPDAPDGRAVGVYVQRRDTTSRLNRLVGGRLFPGRHHGARFTVEDEGGYLRVAFAGVVAADVTVEPSDGLDPGSRLFPDVPTASAFFERGSVAWSEARLDGIELRTPAWHVEPVHITAATSSFFDPIATLDSALLMRDVPVTWHPTASLGA